MVGAANFRPLFASSLVVLAMLPAPIMAANTLDNLGLSSGTPAAGAYAVRKLSSSYAGNAISVRRSSDNTTQDIGFTAGGDLNQAVLLSFVGSGSGYVATWYDQSGNGADITQATAANQPRIVAGGVIETNNTRPALRFGGATQNLTVATPVSTYPVSISLMASTAGGSTNGAFVKIGQPAAPNCGIAIGVGNPDFDGAGTFVVGLKEYSAWCESNPTVSYPASPFTMVAIHQNAAGGNTFSAYLDGANVPLNGATTAPNGTIAGNLYVGGYVSNTPTNRFALAWQSEVLIFGSALSNADRQTIECNQQSYYAIVAPATVGVAQSICGSLTSNSLGGNTPSLGSGAWSKVSGPGTIIFSAPAAGNSTATASVSGTYVLRWTITYNTCASSADITVNFLGSGTLPTANVTGSASICPGVPTNVTVALTGTAPWSLTYSDGTNPTNVTGIASSPYVFSVAPTTAKTYTVTALTDASCSAQPSGLTGSAAITIVNGTLGTTQNAAGAYSLRKVNSCYTGYAATVRRSSDNTTQDIGFTAGGDLNQPALLSFVGAGAGYVAKWYDQSGNGADVIQATTANQPRIVNAGTVETINGKPAVYFGGPSQNLFVSVPVAAYPITVSILGNTAGGSSGGAFVKVGQDQAPNCGIGIGIGNGTMDASGTAVIGLKENASWCPSNPTVAYPASAFTMVAIQQSVAGGSGLAAYLNGAAVTLNNAATATNGITITGNLYVGGYLANGSNNRYPVGWESEVIVFGSALSDGDRQTVECSQQSYYGITAKATVGVTQSICGSLTSNSLGGNTPSLGSGAWSKVSGPGTIIFSAPAAGNSTATASVSGTYVLRWTITYNTCASSADITVNFLGSGTLPTANVTGSASICPGVATNVSVALTGTSPWSLTYFDGTTSTNVTGIAGTPYVFGVAPTVTKTYTVTALTDASCSAQPSGLTGSAVITISNPVLGTTQNAAAAYSVRKIAGCYSGNALTVRRSSDNTTQDIGFTAGGDLNQAALLAFVGSSSGYVVKWYDQSGNGNHIVQATTANQPRIVNAGVVDLIGNRPTLYFSGSPQNLAVGVPVTAYPLTVSILANTSGGSSNGAFVKIGQDASPNCGIGIGVGNGTLDAAGTAVIGLKENAAWCPSSPVVNYPAAAFTLVAIQQSVAGGSGLTDYLNGTAVPLTSATTATNGTTITGNLYVGGYLANGTSNRFPVVMESEVILFGSALSDPDRGTIETNQKNYFGIVPVAPVASNVSFSGAFGIGSAETGSYTYSDGNGDPQATSTFKWYRSNDALGTGKTAIAGATSITYTLAPGDDGKYISFEVTPVSSVAPTTGTPVESALRGPINQITSVWSMTSLGAILGGAIGDNSLFVGTGSAKQLLSRQLSNGNSLWSYATPNGNCGSPSYAFVGSNYDLVAANGTYVVGVQDNGGSYTELFTPKNLGFAVGNPYISIDNSSFYFVCNNTMYSKSLATGATLWTAPLSNASTGSDIVVSSDYIYAPASDGVVKGDVVDFTPLSKYTIAGNPGINLPLSVMHDTLYVTPNTNKLYGVSVTNMTTLYWQATLGATSSAPAFPVYNTSTVYAAAGTAVQKVQGGSVVWTYDVGATITGGPIMMNSVVYFGTSTGKYYAARDNGATYAPVAKWPVTTASGSCTCVWIDQTNSRVIFSTDGGNLDAFPLQ
jgi:hypothetical protein